MPIKCKPPGLSEALLKYATRHILCVYSVNLQLRQKFVEKDETSLPSIFFATIQGLIEAQYWQNVQKVCRKCVKSL